MDKANNYVKKINMVYFFQDISFIYFNILHCELNSKYSVNSSLIYVI